MPELRPFIDGAAPAAHCDFESIRGVRINLSIQHTLSPFLSKDIVCELNTADKRIVNISEQFGDGESSYQWYPEMIEIPYSEGTTYVEVLRSFGNAESINEPHWVLLLTKFPEFIRRYFKPVSPCLWAGWKDGRPVITASDGTVLVSIHESWRDSDAKRRVSRQYRVLDRSHTQWKIALLSAFTLHP
jgi:hypothetical protein